MNLIFPLNIAALRVNENDSRNITGQFQGKTAAFENMPWQDPNNHDIQPGASTGDAIFSPLGLGTSDTPPISPTNPLGTGIHIHWELPDYFKRGRQPDQQSAIQFPAAPNRWLLIRHLEVLDAGAGTYPATACWLIESDYVTAQSPATNRPFITVPLPVKPAPGQQPYMFMGRVSNLANGYNPANPENYLPAFNGANGQPLYLNAVGFVGPYFSSYYPECCSVFGFWDDFSDAPLVQQSITQTNALSFRVSYQVLGWLNEAANDPMAGMSAEVLKEYNDYLNRCKANKTTPQLTALDFFNKILKRDKRIELNAAPTGHWDPVTDTPSLSLCSGLVQDIVWNREPQFFLATDSSGDAVWTGKARLAIGNSTPEALSALLKNELTGSGNQEDLDNYEYLLDALQLGLLKDLETTPNILISLNEAIHSQGFARLHGGFEWAIVNRGENSRNTPEATLPLSLAERLYLLNKAQKEYQTGRDALSLMRRQLYMDWVRYLKISTGVSRETAFTLQQISDFIAPASGNGGELNTVLEYGKKVGLLQYNADESGALTGIKSPAGCADPDSLAYAVWNAYQELLAALAFLNLEPVPVPGKPPVPPPQFQLELGRAQDFQLPGEPVLLIEAEKIIPKRRNGKSRILFARQSGQMIEELIVTFQSHQFNLNTTSLLPALPQLDGIIPAALQTDALALIAENCLLIPMLARNITSTLAKIAGEPNPALENAKAFTNAIHLAIGGQSPLDPNRVPIPFIGEPPKSLYDIVHAEISDSEDFIPLGIAPVKLKAPLELEFQFTNKNNTALPPGAAGWSRQTALPHLSDQRFDPFLPMFIIWQASFSPLQWRKDPQRQLYSPDNIIASFELDEEGVDHTYQVAQSNFTAPLNISYWNNAMIHAGALNTILGQIDEYIQTNKDDKHGENKILQGIAGQLGARNIISQAMSGFYANQVLSAYTAQIEVQNLLPSAPDNITPQISHAAVALPQDNWYSDAFNSLEPIFADNLLTQNFGPLRAGILGITNIEIVDCFGQRLDLTTNTLTNRGALQCFTAASLTPIPADTANQGGIFLPPRVLAPTRLWFNWLSARHNSKVPGVDKDFVESNAHPATSPVCGWILPNHLDDNLFFYNADGTPIGSFGIEGAEDLPRLQYRTRAGNTANTTGIDLAADIGKEGEPKAGINPHLAFYMWHLNSRNAAYLSDLMQAIIRAARFISPSNSARDASLSVLMGRPLAITRVVMGLETRGGLLPLNQSDASLADDVLNKRTDYKKRMAAGSANLAGVEFPVRLGDLVNLDDGLVGFMFENAEANPYQDEPFFSPAAEAEGGNGVLMPADITIQLSLNQDPVSLTLLVDPRAPVHASTGVLGTRALEIPTDQYSTIMAGLQLNFVTRPVLQMAQGLTVPLPAETGFNWFWIEKGKQEEQYLKSNQANESPVYGYSPQTLREGWLELKKEIPATKLIKPE